MIKKYFFPKIAVYFYLTLRGIIIDALVQIPGSCVSNISNWSGIGLAYYEIHHSPFAALFVLFHDLSCCNYRSFLPCLYDRMSLYS